MLKDFKVAAAVNTIVRDACKELDESAAFVRRESPEREAASYALAMGKVFEIIASEILAPLYEEHPEIAPSTWRKRKG